MCTSDSIKAKISKLLRMAQSDNVAKQPTQQHSLKSSAKSTASRLRSARLITTLSATSPYLLVHGQAFQACRSRCLVAAELCCRALQRSDSQSQRSCGEPGYFENQSVIEVLATKGNKVQIELYYQYLYEVMEKLADKAKAEHVAAGFHGDRAFRGNFRKGFARAIGQKLREIRKQQA